MANVKFRKTEQSSFKTNDLSAWPTGAIEEEKKKGLWEGGFSLRGGGGKQSSKGYFSGLVRLKFWSKWG